MQTESIGSVIRDLRKEKKLAQAVVAEAVGISRSHLTNIERGKDLPGRETLMAIANFFEVSLDVLAAAQGRAGGSSKAETESEAILLGAFRSLPKKEAESVIRMLLARLESTVS
ncbi:MAG: helix-turn-helix transcriptional regulator [Acidiphilium sp.]|nr:helix-turn-helix transcriptional regulator [Acidiphilium sp.]